MFWPKMDEIYHGGWPNHSRATNAGDFACLERAFNVGRLCIDSFTKVKTRLNLHLVELFFFLVKGTA